MSAGATAASYHLAKPTNDVDYLAPLFRAAVERAIAECNDPINNLSAMVYETLRARGLPALEPMSFQRPVTVPDGTTAQARFTIVRLPPDTVPNGRTFFCHHHTPGLVWRPE